MYTIKICRKGNTGTTKYIYHNKNLLPDYISAYRKNISTETVLVKIHHDILKAFQEQKGVLLTGLDLSAAFDTMDHDILTLSALHATIVPLSHLVK